jgi:hypothetical protein
MAPKIKVGDLVTFNCAGSRGNTLALVLDIDEGVPMRNAFGEFTPRRPGSIHVQWIQVSRWMPRRWFHSDGNTIEPGEIVRHPFASAFEPAQ